MTRKDRLLAAMPADIDGLFVTSELNQYYFSGFDFAVVDVVDIVVIEFAVGSLKVVVDTFEVVGLVTLIPVVYFILH